jgi:hypothetical protein
MVQILIKSISIVRIINFQDSSSYMSPVIDFELTDIFNFSLKAMPPEATSHSYSLISRRQYFQHGNCGSFYNGTDIVAV